MYTLVYRVVKCITSSLADTTLRYLKVFFLHKSGKLPNYQMKSRSKNTYLTVLFQEAVSVKTAHSQIRVKIVLLETLSTERLYRG